MGCLAALTGCLGEQPEAGGGSGPHALHPKAAVMSPAAPLPSLLQQRPKGLEPEAQAPPLAR